MVRYVKKVPLVITPAQVATIALILYTNYLVPLEPTAQQKDLMAVMETEFLLIVPLETIVQILIWTMEAKLEVSDQSNVQADMWEMRMEIRSL